MMMMMSHAPILPILIPFATALIQLASGRADLRMQRPIGLISTVAGVIAATWLLALADRGETLVYALGNWSAPFGIVLTVDRLAAAMSLLTAVLSAIALLYASAGFDSRGRHFHPLYQLQIMGIQGAFLTGDLFNLFVFFEIMLLASYALLSMGGGWARTRAGIAYVVLNLAGSALFLIALGMLYGSVGSVNLADVAQRLAVLEQNYALARLAAALLIAVFALKAALLPMSFWLPGTYAAAGAPVAALFVIMTKVGVVAILRLHATALAPAAATADLLAGWLVPLAIGTLAIAALGVLAAPRLRALAPWLVLTSAGTLLLVPAQAQPEATAAALYYLVHSTFVGAAFFLLVEMIAQRRGELADRFLPGPAFHAPWLALAFFIAAATVVGLPPFSGFIGKLMLLDTLRDAQQAPWIWSALLLSGFIAMVALARKGGRLFWERDFDLPELASPAPSRRKALALLLLVAAGPLLSVFARPVSDFAGRTAQQLHTPAGYVKSVLGTPAAHEPGEVSR